MQPVFPHFFSRTKDWLSDPRLFHHMPYWIIQAARINSIIYDNLCTGKVTVSCTLSFDIETDDDAGFNGQNIESSKIFLPWINTICNDHHWRSTFFIQGDLVETLASELYNIETHHELGLHGYHHELWGKPIWYGALQNTTPLHTREQLLEKGYRAFEKNGLKSPISFRAPWMIVDSDTLDMLDKYKFLIDSSVFSARIGNPVSFWSNNLLRIPVSVSPIPRFLRHFKIPIFSPYKALNLNTFLLEPLESLVRIIREIITYQKLKGSMQHIVLLAHPWEFNEKSRRCTIQGNVRELFVDRLLLLQEIFDLDWMPLSDIYRKFELTK
jgi:hypothetical protein